MFAAGVDAPWPARLLLSVWRVAMWTLAGLALIVLLLSSLLVILAACDTAGLGLYWVLIPLALWGVGSLALMSIKQARFVAPYLFAATGLTYVFAANQIVLARIAEEIGVDPQLAGFPLFAAYCAAVGITLIGLMQSPQDQVVRWLAIGAPVSLIAGSLMIGPAALLAEAGIDDTSAIAASLVWTGTALTVCSVGTAVLLIAGRTGAVWGFPLLSVLVYLAVLLTLLGATGPASPELAAVTLLVLSCGAAYLVGHLLSGTPREIEDPTVVTARLVEDWT